MPGRAWLPPQVAWWSFLVSLTWGLAILDPGFRGMITGRISLLHWENMALYLPTFGLLYFSSSVHLGRITYFRFQRFQASLLRVSSSEVALHVDLRCEVHQDLGDESMLDVVAQMLSPSALNILRECGVQRLSVASPLLSRSGAMRKLVRHIESLGVSKDAQSRICVPMGVPETLVIRFYQHFSLGRMGRRLGLRGAAKLARYVSDRRFWTRPMQPGIAIQLK